MATTAQQFDLKGHILSLYGLIRASTKVARFYDASGRVLAELPVTADECWYAGCPGCWSNFMLADGPTARGVGASSASFMSEDEVAQPPAVPTNR
jgi:hypothetical protein